MWLKFKQEEARVKTLTVNIRYYKTLKQNLDSVVNKNADEKATRIQHAKLLDHKNITLTNEINMYHDQITALEKDKLTLQENLDKARDALSVESNLLIQAKVSCYIVNIIITQYILLSPVHRRTCINLNSTLVTKKYTYSKA